MPLRMCVAHPIALAALAVLAIGLISYNIITNKKKKIPVRERRIEYVEDYKTETKSCEYPGVRKRRNADTEIKTPNDETIESKKQNITTENSGNNFSTYTNRRNLDFSQGSSVDKEGPFNDLDCLNENVDENSKLLNIIQNINQEDSEKLHVTKTVVDEDAQSSVSNVSATNGNDNDLTEESTSLEYQKSKDDSEVNITEKIYKKEVCEFLKNEIETMPPSSNADSHVSENDSDLFNLRDLGNAERPIICKGCEERFANAVAYPCGHRYLCLDCAIKVHRIYQKCSVCNFHIETYDIINTQEA